jgi:F-type H+-transporting ATPase subunit c
MSDRDADHAEEDGMFLDLMLQQAPSYGVLGAGKAMEAIGRNPEASGTVFLPMIIGVAFAEAVAIYALIIAFILSGR